MKYAHYFGTVGVAFFSINALGQDYRFDPNLIDGQKTQADISLFDQGSQLPGNYDVNILLNGEQVDSRTVAFTLSKDNVGRYVLAPCLTRSQLSSYGVKVENFSDTDGDDGHCFRVNAIPGAKAELDFNAQALQLSIPQVCLRPVVTGIAPQALWNDGIPALLMNYDASSTWNMGRSSGMNSESNWLQLSPGANLGPWRLRNTTVWEQSTGQEGKWQTISTYIERGINSIKSRLTVGDSYTESDIFDSVPLRGMMLSSDDSMSPDSQYMFAPVVRGVARTQARVEVKQGGFTIFNQVVSPGPFALNNIDPSNSNGDLQVTVWETDGHPQVFTVPFQTPAVAVKEGYVRYGLMTGQYRSTMSYVKPSLVTEATATYGLPYNLTVYGGFQWAEHFQSAALGIGAALGELGAVSADVTQSRGQFRDKTDEQGRSIRVRYSRQLVATDTSLALTQYQYNQDGYNTLSDILDSWQNDDHILQGSNYQHQKSRSGVSVTQGLGDWGYLTLSGYRVRYKNGHNDGATINAGYSVPLGGMTVSLNWSQSHTVGNGTDQIVSLWLSVPLGYWLGGNTSASYRWSHTSSGNDAQAVGLSGDTSERRIHWSVEQEYRPGSDHDRNNGNLHMSGYGTYGIFSGNYSYSPSMRQAGAALNGGVVIHRHGITFSQPLGNTIALVEAPGAAGLSVGGMPGARTDFRGYTTSSFMVPYQENDISLNPTELPPDLDITETDIKVVPTEGAVIPATFVTRRGGRALITLMQTDGHPVPFGALAVSNGEGDAGGVVGDDGGVYLTGLQNHINLSAKWSKHDCRASLLLPEKPGPGGIYRVKAVCR